MALITQPVLGDVGSNELYVLRKSYNALLDAIVAAADYATLKTNVQLAATGVVKVVDTRELPRPRQFPTE